MPEGDRPITEDRLRAVFAEFELRLMDRLEEKFERKADLVLLNEARRQLADHAAQLGRLERWRSYLAGVASFATFLAGVAVAVAFH